MSIEDKPKVILLLTVLKCCSLCYRNDILL